MLRFVNSVADNYNNKSAPNGRAEEKINSSVTSSVNNSSRAKVIPNQRNSQGQQYHNGWYGAYDYGKHKTDPVKIEEKAENDANQQWLQDQDIAVRQMWSTRYAESLPLCTRPIIEIQEPGKMDDKVANDSVKENTCIHGSAYVGTTCDCTKCAISNGISFTLDMSKQETASAIKKASGGRRNFRYNVWCTGRKYGNILQPTQCQDNDTQVNITK